MARADREWPAQQTVRLLLAGNYSEMHRQLESLFGHQAACRIILRSVLRRADETDADAFEEKRHGR
jgi:hypothetical protein